jgi:transposase
MRSKVETESDEAEKRVRDIRRATRRQYSAEEKIRIVIAGLRGEDSIAELCRKEGINQNLYYRWSKRTSWRRERSGWRAIRHGERPVTRSRRFRRIVIQCSTKARPSGQADVGRVPTRLAHGRLRRTPSSDGLSAGGKGIRTDGSTTNL